MLCLYDGVVYTGGLGWEEKPLLGMFCGQNEQPVRSHYAIGLDSEVVLERTVSMVPLVNRKTLTRDKLKDMMGHTCNKS